MVVSGVAGCDIRYGGTEENTDAGGWDGGADNIGGGTLVFGSAVDIAGCWMHSETKIDCGCNVCDSITFVDDWLICTVWTADGGIAACDVIWI